uniref:hypothetical protein n=1 Tax=Orenia metallireducens TaxID=1413210 RepID=UPI0015E5F242|nr:hypothetical protein [Orenia metallireducens]
MKAGYPSVIIRNEDRARDYSSLDKACTTGDYDDFISLVVESLNKSLDMYLDLIG